MCPPDCTGPIASYSSNSHLLRKKKAGAETLQVETILSTEVLARYSMHINLINRLRKIILYQLLAGTAY